VCIVDRESQEISITASTQNYLIDVYMKRTFSSLLKKSLVRWSGHIHVLIVGISCDLERVLLFALFASTCGVGSSIDPYVYLRVGTVCIGILCSSSRNLS
jgi:hypothetical protein